MHVIQYLLRIPHINTPENTLNKYLPQIKTMIFSNSSIKLTVFLWVNMVVWWQWFIYIKQTTVHSIVKYKKFSLFSRKQFRFQICIWKRTSSAWLASSVFCQEWYIRHLGLLLNQGGGYCRVRGCLPKPGRCPLLSQGGAYCQTRKVSINRDRKIILWVTSPTLEIFLTSPFLEEIPISAMLNLG
jgi:hypothetical protein